MDAEKATTSSAEPSVYALNKLASSLTKLFSSPSSRHKEDISFPMNYFIVGSIDGADKMISANLTGFSREVSLGNGTGGGGGVGRTGCAVM